MADIGDFDFELCQCAEFLPTPGTLAPGPSDVGDFDFFDCCPVAAIVSPAADEDLDPAAEIVASATSPEGGIANIVITVSFAEGAPVTVFTTSDGFEPGFVGSTAAILDGVQVTFHSLAGWPVGTLLAEIDVIDSADAEATGSREWTVAPVAPADGAPDLVAQALSRVIIQYRSSQKLLQEIRVFVSAVQELVNVAIQISELDDNTIATGVNLDANGDIVGQPRQLSDGDVATDSEYVVLQTAKASRNAANGTPENLLSILTTFLGAQVRLSDHGAMGFSYVVMRQPTADEASVLGDLLARPMGVKVTRSWAPTVYFGYSADPGASGYGVGHYTEGF